MTLSRDRADTSGIPAPVLTYRISDNSKALLAWHCQRAAESLTRRRRRQDGDRSPSRQRPFHGHCLHGRRPETSVVDRWGMSHDVPNLGIIDGSVFVTAGGVNPTPTICGAGLAGRGAPSRDSGRRLVAPYPSADLSPA